MRRGFSFFFVLQKFNLSVRRNAKKEEKWKKSDGENVLNDPT